MTIGHIMGIPVEETALQFTAAGAATVTVAAIAGRVTLARLVRRVRRRGSA